jgi:hypothetical protein
VSVTDETMQAMTVTREGSPFDVLLDTCGGALALAALAKISSLKVAKSQSLKEGARRVL